MSLLEKTFQKFPLSPNIIGCEYPPPSDKLYEMLKMEEFIRMSPEYSDECSKIKDEVNGWLRISGEVQEKVAHLFGYSDPLSKLLVVNYMRRAPYLFPYDKRFTETQVYVRNNLAIKGNLVCGNPFPMITLYNLKEELIDTHSILDNSKYNVIIASSET